MSCACPACGRPVPVAILGGRLLAARDPHVIYWQGVALDITPAQARLLEHMIWRGGEISHGAIEMVAIDTSPNGASARVQISRLRLVLKQHRIPMQIESVRQWGYRLRDMPAI